MAESDAQPAMSAEGRRLIEAYAEAQFAAGDHDRDHQGEPGYGALHATCEAAGRALDAYVAGLEAEVDRLRGSPPSRFSLGDPIRKTKGSFWHGRVVGYYSTTLTPIGYAVESSREPGSVQIYPESALEAWDGQ